MCYLRFQDDPDSCHYSAPLPIIPVMLADTLKLHEIAFTPIFGGESTKTVQDLDGPFPWEQYISNEYSQKLREAEGIKYRDDVKPYHISQPQGASVSLIHKPDQRCDLKLNRDCLPAVQFTLDGRVIRWQKYSMHIGFNYREGTVISDIRYEGRKLFHRLSISDMVSRSITNRCSAQSLTRATLSKTVPYGDPRVSSRSSSIRIWQDPF